MEPWTKDDPPILLNLKFSADGSVEACSNKVPGLFCDGIEMRHRTLELVDVPRLVRRITRSGVDPFMPWRSHALPLDDDARGRGADVAHAEGRGDPDSRPEQGLP